MSNPTPQQWASRAGAAAQGGDAPGALRILDEARQAYPQEAGLWHYSGKLALQAGNPGAAADFFARACDLAGGKVEFAIDQAIALTSAGRLREALDLLAHIESAGTDRASYWSARANAARSHGDAADAADWYERALALEPQRATALHGRAGLALERGEADAVARFDKALQVDAGNAQLWLGKAQALDVAGDTRGARTIIEQVVAQAPHYTDALFFLAQLRQAQGEEDYTSHYADAAAKVPQDPNIPDSWARTLAGMDSNAEAANVIGEARARFPQIERFKMLEAIYAGANGDDDRAEMLFADLDDSSDDRKVHEARHRIRRGEFDHAEALLEVAEEQVSHDIRAWALRGILWRLSGDPREEWLHEQANLHGLLPLQDAESVLPPAIAKLHALHDGSPLPLGQSLRGGTQTRGRLFDRGEPEFQRLRAAIEATLEDYRAGLPARDPAHPLLRHRETDWRIVGSWSVRLSGGGDYHTSHIHPQGIVSSALYCELPDEVTEDDADRHGWLELGRPPPDLRLELGPITVIRPRAGHLALFPSTLYHGTRPFDDGRRMTVAFDVALADKPSG